jgi:hypothetical protein
MAKMQGSDGRIDKRKIAILNIDSILNCFILSSKNMKVPNIASPKWAYTLKLVEKWLCKTRKYKAVAGGAILNYSSILKFCRKLLLQYFFINWFF